MRISNAELFENIDGVCEMVLARLKAVPVEGNEETWHRWRCAARLPLTHSSPNAAPHPVPLLARGEGETARKK